MTLFLILLNESCTNEIKKKQNQLNWDEITFGVGLLSSEEDSTAWIQFPILSSAIHFEEESENGIFYFVADTLVSLVYSFPFSMQLDTISNEYYNKIKNDTVKYSLSFAKDSVIHFDLIVGPDSAKNKLNLKMYPKKPPEKFNYLTFNNYSMGSSISVAVFRDSINGLVKEPNSNYSDEPLRINFDDKAKAFLYAYVNAVVDNRENYKDVSQSIWGHSSSLNLEYDDTTYEYNESFLFKFQPHWVYSYVVSGMDST